MRLYTSVVIPSAIYASETWRTTDKTNRMLNVFNRRCLRDIMGVSWKNHMTSEELLSTAGIRDLQGIVADRRRRFIGHVLCLPTSRPARLATDWTPEGGSRRWSRPKRTGQDTCREDLQEINVSGSDSHEARSIASDHAQGRQLVAQCSRTGGPKSKSKFKPRTAHHKKRLSCLRGIVYRVPLRQLSLFL